jgi:polyphosphate kinase 2 (PPK2 family)
MGKRVKNTGKISAKQYEKQLRKLQGELCKLQDWVKHNGLRIIVIFEGRDGAGKGGTIRAITERVSPRIFRVVALPAPSDREKSQMYMQRYMAHFPAAGEIVIFDRSGTTARASNTSWDSARRSSTAVFSITARSREVHGRCRDEAD